MKQSQRLGIQKIEEKPRRKKGVLFFLLELIVILFVVGVIALGGLAWRLHSSPLDIGFAKEEIEAQLRDDEMGLRAQTQKVALHWPDLGGPLYLWADDVQVLNREGGSVLSMNKVALSLSIPKLFIGQVQPAALIIKEPELKVSRNNAGEFDVGFGALKGGKSLVAEEGGATLAQQVLEIISESGDVHNPLAGLKVVDVQDARVLYSDSVAQKEFVFEPVDLRLGKVDQGVYLSLDFALKDEVNSGNEAAVTAKLVIPQSAQDLKLKAEARDFDVALLSQYVDELDSFKDQSGAFNLKLDGVLDGDFIPSRINIQAHSDEGKIFVPDYYPEGFDYKDFVLAAEYDYQEKMLIFNDTRITAGGIPIAFGADLVVNDGELTGPITVDIEGLNHEQIDPLWPESLKDDNSHKWVVEKISDARFKDVYAGFFLRALQGESGWSVDTEDLKAGFDFSGATVNYRAPLMPVTEGKGHGRFNLEQERLDVIVESGRLGDMDVASGDLIFADIIDAGQGDADIKVKLSGPLPAAFRYIEDEPIGAKHGFDLSKVQGNVEMDIHLMFPTHDDIKVEEVQVDIAGKVTDAVLPGAVKDLSLTGGPFDVSIKDHLLHVQGDGKLDGRAVKADYKEYLISKGKPFKSKATANIVADPNLRAKFGIDLGDFLEGSAPARVVYTDYVGGKSIADVKVDATPVRLFVDAFDYNKPVGVKGGASLQAVLQNQKLVEIRDLKVEAPGLSVAGGKLGFRNEELASGKISAYKIGSSQGDIEFEIEPSGLQKIVVGGSYLDLRPFLNNDGGKPKAYNEPPKRISVAVNEMQTAFEQRLHNGKIYIDIDGQGVINQLELDGVVGKGDVYLRFKVDDTGQRTFRLEADDAGATLKAFEVYDKMDGGTMVIYGEPMRGVYDRNLSGTAHIMDFKVKKAPGLAKLLSAMSLPGIIQLLDNDGLVFSKMETKFDWLYNPEGSKVVLTDGRTAGNSVGLTFDGTIDQAVGQMDLSGTIVPLSGLNEAISSIPLIGTILSGGTDSVFAATYTMRGESKDPKVTVNPLSVLAPGLIRRILFEN